MGTIKENSRINYYLKCGLGGALSCGLTHSLITPVDIAKCRIQMHPEKYKNLISALRLIGANEGLKGLRLGLVPAFIGYSAQGALKHGLYEYFKDAYFRNHSLRRKEKREPESKIEDLVWLGASASAEFLADVALCPMEMLKLKIQASNQSKLWSGPFITCIKNMYKLRRETKFPFGSLTPLWSRQIPYTMTKFYFFEKIVNFTYKNVFRKPKESYSKHYQLFVTFISGYLSGVICAFVSHPADMIVTQLSTSMKTGNCNIKRNISDVAKEIGIRKLFTAGLGTRMIMIGTLTGMQWWIYDAFKSTMGFETTGNKTDYLE
ncbi:PfMPC [Cryptosporidium ryanae]|uniref:PfMPC n=1 Tax=Cryptosporidium ryanae TaxID=515981 RepID=UPI00351A55A9|nr:PfMPC [Cryptosporidium ryanae]